MSTGIHNKVLILHPTPLADLACIFEYHLTCFSLNQPKKCLFISFSHQYLIKVNEIKTKKGVDLLQNLIKYYHAQCK